MNDEKMQAYIDECLIKFCRLGDFDMVRYLVQMDAKVSQEAIRAAAEYGYTNIVEYLINFID